MRSLIFILVLGATAAWSQSSPTVLHSPDGRLAISLQTETEGVPNPGGGRLVYSVSFQGKPLINASALSLELEGQEPLGADVRIVSATRSQKDETYRLLTGKTSVARDHHNGCDSNPLEVNLQAPSRNPQWPVSDQQYQRILRFFD